MAFNKLINYKRIISLLGVFTLFGTNVLMAAEEVAATAATGTTAEKPDVWSGVFYYVLLFLIVCVVIAIVGKILKVYDLSQQIQGKNPINWNRVMGTLCGVMLIVGMFGAYWSFTVQGSMILPESASAHGKEIDTMFFVTFAITVAVFIITQILLFSFAFKYKHSNKRKATYYPHNNALEAAWTITPAIVLTILVVFGFTTWKKVTNSADVEGDIAAIDVSVIGRQFAWDLRYPGKDQKLGKISYKLVTPTNKSGVDFKDKNSFDDLLVDTMVVPVNKPVRLNIDAQDVIHSVYMPHFRLQLNAVPGLPTFFKFTPTITSQQMKIKENNPKFEYLLYCNKICGGGHYNMQRVVRVVTEAEYQKWLSQQKPYLTDQLKEELKLADVVNVKDGENNRLALNN